MKKGDRIEFGDTNITRAVGCAGQRGQIVEPGEFYCWACLDSSSEEGGGFYFRSGDFRIISPLEQLAEVAE